MCSRTAWLTACSAVVLAAAGCGGDAQQASQPQIEASAATALAGRSEEIARLLEAGAVCDAAHAADQLKLEVDSAISTGQVPRTLAEELTASAEALVNEVNCDAPPAAEENDEDKDGKGEKSKDDD